MAKKRVRVTVKLLDNLSQGGDKGPSHAQIRRTAIAINKKVVAPLMHDYVLDNFLVGGRPRFEANSKPWRNWKIAHGYPSRPLWMTGTLFQKAILDPVVEVTEDSVILRARRPTTIMLRSMRRLHDGGGGIPARPWTKLLPAQESRIKKVRAVAWQSAIAGYASTGKLEA